MPRGAAEKLFWWSTTKDPYTMNESSWNRVENIPFLLKTFKGCCLFDIDSKPQQKHPDLYVVHSVKKRITTFSWKFLLKGFTKIRKVYFASFERISMNSSPNKKSIQWCGYVLPLNLKFFILILPTSLNMFEYWFLGYWNLE